MSYTAVAFVRYTLHMATIVNAPQPTSSNNGSGFLLGVILLIAFVVLFFFYGLPYLTSMISPTPQVNVPSNIDVHVK
jgi:hypothetical protein